jgi:hypothetical protein
MRDMTVIYQTITDAVSSQDNEQIMRLIRTLDNRCEFFNREVTMTIIKTLSHLKERKDFSEKEEFFVDNIVELFTMRINEAMHQMELKFSTHACAEEILLLIDKQIVAIHFFNQTGDKQMFLFYSEIHALIEMLLEYRKDNLTLNPLQYEEVRYSIESYVKNFNAYFKT